MCIVDWDAGCRFKYGYHYPCRVDIGFVTDDAAGLYVYHGVSPMPM